jgi:hypothetical protein
VRRRLVLLLPCFAIVCAVLAAPAQGYLFFGNPNNDAIGRLNSDGSNVQPLWRTGIEEPKAVASDGTNLYWASKEGTFKTTVGSVGINGRNFRASIFDADLAPADLTVGGGRLFLDGDASITCTKIPDTFESDSNAAQLQTATTDEGTDIETMEEGACITWGGVAASHDSAYWIDRGYELWEGDEEPTIHQSAVGGGTSRIVVNPADLEEPAGLAADEEHLYWADAHAIGRATFKSDGSVEAINPNFITGLDGPGYPAVDGQYLYWVAPNSQEYAVFRADKQTGGGVRELAAIPDTHDLFEGNIPFGLATSEPEALAFLSQESLSFGARQVGSGPGQPQTVALIDNGELALSASSVEISGPAAGDFTLVNGCQQQVPPGGGCGVVLKFQPGAPGKRTATLTIANNAGESPFHVALSGVGLGPSIAITPATASFGEQKVKAGATAPRSFVVENVGNEPMQVDEVVLGDQADFDFESEPEEDCGKAAIAPGHSCMIEVSFNPASAGAKSTTLQVGAAAPAAPATATATLTGTGTKPGLTIAPETVSFPTTVVGQTSPAQTVTISNPGTAPLEVKGVSATGSTANQFHPTSSCGTLAPGASCQVQITFAPTAVGAKLDHLQVLTDYFATNSTTTLRGMAVSPEASLTPSEVDVAPLNVGSGPGATTTFTFESTGTETIEVESVALGGDGAEQFELVAAADKCSGATLEADDACTVGVAFDPARTGALTAKLEIDDNAFPDPHTAVLEGVGTKPEIAVSATSLAFPQILLGATTASQSFSVSNPGSGPLRIDAVEVEGAGAGAFSVAGGSCTAGPIPAGALNACAITVAFASGSAGQLGATVKLSSDATAGQDSVAVGGLACPAVGARATALKPPRRYAVSARFEAVVPATMALTATLRYRFKGKPHSFALGPRSVDAGGSLVFAIPHKLRKRIDRGKRVNLLFAGSATPASPPGCAAQGSVEQALSVRVGR